MNKINSTSKKLKRVFIGHRGVGKSSMLKRHMRYFEGVPHFDLDAEIEKKLGLSVSQYFELYGEEEFRKTEIQVFSEISNKYDSFAIAVGAGFSVDIISNDCEVWWISRVTDEDGRIFLNRPSLEKNVSDLEEYSIRYKKRNPLFFNRADHIYFLSEGIDSENNVECELLKNEYLIHDAYYTLTKHDEKCLPTLLQNFEKLELRTDLFSLDEIKLLQKKYGKHKFLVSVRTSVESDFFAKQVELDTDVQYFNEHATIVSSHNDSIDLAIKELSPVQYQNKHLKLSPKVKNLSELIIGYKWQQTDAQNRSFLPRSEKDQFLWYRQLAKYFQKMNFVRSFTFNLDQPSIFQWLSLPNTRPNKWAAVLGQPIYFSRSVMFHAQYFKSRNTFMLAIDVVSSEFKEQIQFLTYLGLKYAAVTSPLKELAFELCQSTDDLTGSLKTVNTFYLNSVTDIVGLNTDLDGFKKITQKISDDHHVVIWGGGGTLPIMKKVLPRAISYSSQTGKPREESFLINKDCNYLIWAAPRRTGTLWPNLNFKNATVIDLNYRENSMGLEFAKQQGLAYISGIEMFKEQALKQQLFWSKYECK